MLDINVRYYTDNPNPDKTSDNEKIYQCIGILDLNIRTEDLDDDIINIIDKKKYLESVSLSSHIRSKNECERLIILIDKIKNNLKY